MESPSELALLHAVCSTPDVSTLYLRSKDDWVRDSVSEDEKFLVKPDDGDDFFLAEYKTALMLSWWMGERTEGDIADRFDVGPGDIRSRVDTGEWVAYSFRELARLFGSPMLPAIDDIVLRLQKGVKKELLGLARLRGVGRVRARMLWNNGFRGPEDVAACTPEKLAALPGIGDRLAVAIIEQARKV
jgi:helicase